jgi:hypothetical protein
LAGNQGDYLAVIALRPKSNTPLIRVVHSPEDLAPDADKGKIADAKLLMLILACASGARTFSAIEPRQLIGTRPCRLDPCPKIDLAKIFVFYESTEGSAGV